MPAASEPTGDSPPAEPDAPRRRQRALLWTLALVFVTALLLRALFISGVAASHDTHSFAHFNGDSPDYFHLGFNIAADEKYITGTLRSRIKALVRPPAYPLLIAGILETVGPDVDEGLDDAFWYAPGQPEWPSDKPREFENGRWLTPAVRPAVLTLYGMQAVADSLLAVLAGWLAWRLWRQVWLVAVAGFAMALNLTGIALTSAVLVDGLFAFLGTSALVATIECARSLRARGTTRGVVALAALAGVLWGVAQLTKPTLALWPVGLLVVWWLLAGRKTFTRRGLVCLLLVWGGLVVALGAWVARNAWIEGVPTPSAVTERNLRLMMAPDVAAWAELDKRPSKLDRRKYYRQYGAEDRTREGEPGMTTKRYVREQREAAMAVLREHPDIVWRTYLRNLESVLVDPWDVLERQLPTARSAQAPDGTPNAWTAAVRHFFEPLWLVDDAKLWRWIWAGMALFSPLPAWVAWWRARRGERRWQVAMAWALLLWCVYLTLISGTTRDQGSRILYPAHAASFVLVLAWLAWPAGSTRSDEETDGSVASA